MLNYESVNVNAKPNTTEELLNWGQKMLRHAGIDDPKREALELLSHNCHFSKAHLMAHPEQKIKKVTSYLNNIKKRAKRFPLQYLLGTEYFSGLELEVGPGVLIPRPETALIIDIINAKIKDQSEKIVADLGTGSGNLSLALATHYPKWQIIGIDRSPKALYWARRKKKTHKIKNVRFLQRFAEQGLPKKYDHQLDIVVSNPPYIIQEQLKTLQPEVRYEPNFALNGGQDGLKLIKIVAHAAVKLLKPKGLFLCEIGQGQSQNVVEILKKDGFKNITIKLDWQDIPRIVYANI